MTEKAVFVDLTDGREIVVSDLVHVTWFHSQHCITLGTRRMGTDEDGKLREEIAIVARLRFSNDTAKVFAHFLDEAIKGLTGPGPEKAN